MIAAGSRPVVPDIEGLEEVGFHTSDTIMRIDALPDRLLIIGGGFVARSSRTCSARFGTHVTIVNRSASAAAGRGRGDRRGVHRLAQNRWDVRLETEVEKVERYAGGSARGSRRQHRRCGRRCWSPTGRRSNADGLDLDRTGVSTRRRRRVVVDDHQRTNVEGVWALGDIANHFQLKHVSNLEARVVQHNLLHPDDLRARRHDVVPSAVFSHPQVASVGLTERQAVAQGVELRGGPADYGDTAYGWAMEDTTGFAKVLADPDTGQILGAHVLGPAGVQPGPAAHPGDDFGQTAHEVAREQYWIHPALMEVVENLLLALPAP